jgi:hypothetical protein
MSLISKMISEYEENRSDSISEAFEPRPVTIRMPVDDLSLAQAVADYYQMSRAAFLQQIIDASLIEFFNSLPNESRMTIAKSAEEIAIKEMEKLVSDKGGTYYRVGFCKWLGLAKVLNGELELSQ